MTELQILYETEDFMFVYKPPYTVLRSDINLNKYLTEPLPDDMKCYGFMVSIIKHIKDSGEDVDETISNGLCQRYDFQTSGIMMVTKKKSFFNSCREIINNKDKTIKIYCCLVNGIIEQKSGFIKTRIHKPDKTKFTYDYIADINDRRGFISASYYQVIKEYEYNGNNYSYVFVRIFTGRPHQIRLHMKYLGTPIVSDRCYNDPENYKQNLQVSSRMFLHNFKLCVVVNDEQICLTAKLSEELKETLDKMNKTNSYEIQELDKISSPLTLKDMKRRNNEYMP